MDAFIYRSFYKKTYINIQVFTWIASLWIFMLSSFKHFKCLFCLFANVTYIVQFWQFELTKPFYSPFGKRLQKRGRGYRDRHAHTAFPQCPSLSSREQAYRRKSLTHNQCAFSGFPPGSASQRMAKHHDSTQLTWPFHSGPSVCLWLCVWAIHVCLCKCECICLYICILCECTITFLSMIYRRI